MKSLTVLLGVLICIVVIQARHVEKSENERAAEDLTENQDSLRDSRATQRHRRKRWQMNYGYDYPPPPHSYYPDRRELDRNQDLIPQILRLLDEIAAYVKRPNYPPVAPQPIYVPYPVPYPFPQNCACNDQANTPNVTNRFPEMEDTNQNWGLIDPNHEVAADDGKDGARPISFEPIRPNRPMKRPSPKVEHGTTQASTGYIAPKQDRVPVTTGRCDAAILSCCNNQQRDCFVKFDCPNGYARRETICSRDSVEAALQAFKDKYSPA